MEIYAPIFFCSNAITASNSADGVLVSMTGATLVSLLADVVPVDCIPLGIPPMSGGPPAPISGGPPAAFPPAPVADSASEELVLPLLPWLMANSGMPKERVD